MSNSDYERRRKNLDCTIACCTHGHVPYRGKDPTYSQFSWNGEVNSLIMQTLMLEWELRDYSHFDSYLQWLPLEIMDDLSQFIKTWLWFMGPYK